jgi:hypothetical protein
MPIHSKPSNYEQTNTEQTNTEQTNSDTRGVTEWSHHIIETFTLMNKTKAHSKKAFLLIEEYIKKNDLKLSEEEQHDLKMLSSIWSNDEKFDCEEFLSVVETYTNKFSINLSTNKQIGSDEYFVKLWTVYEKFTEKTISATKEIEKIHKENYDKVNLSNAQSGQINGSV